MESTSLQEKMNPDSDFYPEEELSEEFYERLKIMEEFEVVESLDEEEDEEEFSFVFGGEDAAAIAAEDAFSEGQIKTVFPLFGQYLLFSGDERPPVEKVFVESKEESGEEVTSSNPVTDEIAGPYCEWSNRKAPPPEVCKKSNSTGFCKIWRLKERTARSNSDGRDAFVFLRSHAPPKSEEAVKKSGKGKTAAVSAHEVYLRSKAKGEERRRSYLPYRPELMGFFTNVNGGLTKNVHPF